MHPDSKQALIVATVVQFFMTFCKTVHGHTSSRPYTRLQTNYHKILIIIQKGRTEERKSTSEI